MPPLATRKRPAPGASPVKQAKQLQQQQQSLELDLKSEASQMATDQYLQWHEQHLANPATSYPDTANDLTTNIFNALNQATPAPLPAVSNQLARRPATHHLVPHTNFANTGDDSWPIIAEDGVQPPQDQAWRNSNDELEREAQIARRDTQAKRKQIPPFVQKLSSFLDESRNTDLIRWSQSGDSFIVVDEDEFAKTLIPELFKHNNYASFVRQLNMYGFHKKVGLSDNSMRASERKNKSPSEYWNPYFKRGRPNLLWLVQKPKNPHSKGGGKGGGRIKPEDGNLEDEGEDVLDGDFPANLNSVFPEHLQAGRQPLMIGQGGRPPQEELANVHRELQAVLQQQKLISNMLRTTREDYMKLFRQAAAFQSLHEKHETSINAILTFLATVYNRSLEGEHSNFSNMFAGAIPPDSQGPGNVVDVGEYGDQVTENKTGQTPRFRKQPLLLKAPPQTSQPSTTQPPDTQPASSHPSNSQLHPPNSPWEQMGRILTASPGSSNDVDSPLPLPESRLPTSPALNNTQPYPPNDVMLDFDNIFNSENYFDEVPGASLGSNIENGTTFNTDDLENFNFDTTIVPDGGGGVDGAFPNGFDLPVEEDRDYTTNVGNDGQVPQDIKMVSINEATSPAEVNDNGSLWSDDGRGLGKRRRI